MTKVIVSKDSSGRTIYCVGDAYFYTRSKAEKRAGGSASSNTSTTSDAYYWTRAGRSNPRGRKVDLGWVRSGDSYVSSDGAWTISPDGSEWMLSDHRGWVDGASTVKALKYAAMNAARRGVPSGLSRFHVTDTMKQRKAYLAKLASYR